MSLMFLKSMLFTKFTSCFIVNDITALTLQKQIKILLQIILGILVDVFILPFLGVVCFLKRLLAKNKKKNIFIGCFPNNNYIHVAKALRGNGFNVTLVPYFIPPHEKGIINYDMDLEAEYPRLYKNWLGNKLMGYGLFIWVVINFDVVIMPFLNRLLDRMPLSQWFEFQLLKIARIYIILNPYASDIYTPKFCNNDFVMPIKKAYEEDPYYKTINQDYVLKARNYGEKHAHKIIAALDLVDYLSRVDHLLQMRCIDLSKIVPVCSKIKNTPLKVLHAPNHQNLKGTSFLISAVNKINLDKKIIDLIIVEKTSNKKLMKILQDVDIVADQFFMGAYGRLAIEAMAYGKPVLCYLRADLKKIYPHWNECPIINTSVSNIEEKLRYVLKMPINEINRISIASRKFIEKFHSFSYIGNEMGKIIQDLY